MSFEKQGSLQTIVALVSVTSTSAVVTISSVPVVKVNNRLQLKFD